jgi:hypothetical protein
MSFELITQRGNLLIRRQRLEPGEALPWHVDRCHRFTVVVQGERLGIEFRDTGEVVEVPVNPGLAEWDVPEPRVHRGVNLGAVPYEEVVTFYLNHPGEDPQPEQAPV